MLVWKPFVPPLDHLNFILRATQPSSDHNFLEQRTTRNNSDKVLFHVPVSFGENVWFEFNRSDWVFEANDWIASSRIAIVNRLTFQFKELEDAHPQAVYAWYKEAPLPLYTKVLILRGSQYNRRAGIVVGNENSWYRKTTYLKVLVDDGNVITCTQGSLYLLDPENTLPFGIPVSRDLIRS